MKLTVAKERLKLKSRSSYEVWEEGAKKVEATGVLNIGVHRRKKVEATGVP